MIRIHTPIAHTPMTEIYIVKIRRKVQMNTLMMLNAFTLRKTLHDI